MQKKKMTPQKLSNKLVSHLKTWLVRYGWLGLLLAISLYFGRNLLTAAHFHTHDDIQIFRTNEFMNCFRDGQFPCRWSRDLGKGYGYPLFIFYPPMIYTLPALLVAITKVPIAFALNLIAYLTFPLAALGMYRLIFTLTSRRDLSAIAGILYTLLPYHAVNIFVRGVYAENLAWAFIPYLFAELYLLIKVKKPIWTFSILLALAVMSHNISAMLLFPMLGIWGLALILSDWKKLGSRLKSCILAGILGVGISSFFLLPAILEKPLVQTESMIFDYYSYLVHFPTIKQIFLTNYWGYGGSGWGVKDDGMSFALGQVHWVGLLVAGVIALWFSRRRVPQFVKNPLISVTGALLLTILFLSHPRSTPIWELIKPLQYIQFPWRLIGLSGMLTVTLTAYLLSLLPTKLGKTIGLICALAAIYLYGGFFRPEKFDGLVDQDFLTGKLRTLQQQDHVFDYLPKTVKELPDFASGLYFSSEAPITHKTLAWTSNRAELELSSNISQDVTLSVFVYPGWIAKLNNQETTLKPHAKFGLATVSVPKGDSRITLEFHETTTRKIGTAISFVSLGILILGTISTKKAKRT